MKLKLTLLLNDISHIQKLECVRPLGPPGEFELVMPESSAAGGTEGRITVGGLLAFLGIDPEKDVIFVIINKKITFADVELCDLDHVELLAAVDGG
jgi:sulfur carrier protein ThiS